MKMLLKNTECLIVNGESRKGKIVTEERSGRPRRKLEVWQRSMKLVNDIYGLTRNFPKEETYGLSSQMQRSAVSLPSNIACPVKYKSKYLMGLTLFK